MAILLASIRQTPGGYAVRPASKRTVLNAVVCNVCGEALAEVWRSRVSGGFKWCERGAGLVGSEPTREEALGAARNSAAATHKCSGYPGQTDL